MWSSFKESVKANMTTFVDSTTNMYNRLSSYPDEVKCPNFERCKTVIPVPATAFYWTCLARHSNPPTENTCTAPGCPHPRTAINPYVECPTCHVSVSVPTTTIARNLQEGFREAPSAIKSAAVRAGEEISSLGHTPRVFPCGFCSAQLTTPMGPWVCALHGCNTANSAGASTCSKCSGNRYAAGVCCGVCSRVTPVPSTRFSAGLTSTVGSAITGTVKTVNYISGTPYVNCRTCQAVCTSTVLQQQIYWRCYLNCHLLTYVCTLSQHSVSATFSCFFRLPVHR